MGHGGVRLLGMTFPELDRITIDPAVMGGKPCIRGARVTVGAITGLLASDTGHDEILRLYLLPIGRQQQNGPD